MSIDPNLTIIIVNIIWMVFFLLMGPSTGEKRPKLSLPKISFPKKEKMEYNGSNKVDIFSTGLTPGEIFKAMKKNSEKKK